MARFLDKLKAHSALGYFQTFCYFMSVFFGFFVAVPVGVTLRNFDGKCILFAELVWDNTVIYPWSESACDFPLYMTIAVAMFYGISMGIFTLLAVIPRTEKYPRKFAFTQASSVKFLLLSLNPVLTFVNAFVCCLMLGSALLITSGFASFCSDLVESMENTDTPISSCFEAQNLNWNKINVMGGMDHGVNGGSFHISYTFAVIGSWALVVVWVLLLISNFSQTCRGCSCGVAEEKQKLDKSYQIAARRSRLATPIGSPGHLTPRSYGQVPLAQQQGHQQGAHGYTNPAQIHLQPLPPKH